MNARGTDIQRTGPIRFQLIVHEALSARKIFDPTKTVVMPLVAYARLIHLPGEPLASIHVNVKGEREPCLQTCTHEAQGSVDPVVIDIETLPQAALQFQLLRLPVALYAPTEARLHGGEPAHGSTGDPISLRNGTSHFLLAFLAAGQILDGPIAGLHGFH